MVLLILSEVLLPRVASQSRAWQLHWARDGSAGTRPRAIARVILGAAASRTASRALAPPSTRPAPHGAPLIYQTGCPNMRSPNLYIAVGRCVCPVLKFVIWNLNAPKQFQSIDITFHW